MTDPELVLRNQAARAGWRRAALWQNADEHSVCSAQVRQMAAHVPIHLCPLSFIFTRNRSSTSILPHCRTMASPTAQVSGGYDSMGWLHTCGGERGRVGYLVTARTAREWQAENGHKTINAARGGCTPADDWAVANFSENCGLKDEVQSNAATAWAIARLHTPHLRFKRQAEVQHAPAADRTNNRAARHAQLHALVVEGGKLSYSTTTLHHKQQLALRSSMHLLLSEANSRRNLPRKGASGSSRIVPAARGSTRKPGLASKPWRPGRALRGPAGLCLQAEEVRESHHGNLSVLDLPTRKCAEGSSRIRPAPRQAEDRARW